MSIAAPVPAGQTALCSVMQGLDRQTHVLNVNIALRTPGAVWQAKDASKHTHTPRMVAFGGHQVHQTAQVASQPQS